MPGWRSSTPGLELSNTDKERNTILEAAVALAKHSETTATALYQAGKVPASDPLVAKAGRLEAEIALEPFMHLSDALLIS
jgi:hypothetical protein